MTISSKTLDSIQAAGAAAFAAHAELQTTVSEYSERVKAAVMGNAFDMGNDNLFEEWKTLARLTQAVGSGIAQGVLGGNFVFHQQSVRCSINASTIVAPVVAATLGSCEQHQRNRCAS
jgi:hypothetical protein